MTVTDAFMSQDHGGHRSSSSTSSAAILAAFIPTFITAVVYLVIFVAIRNRYPKIYAPRTFMGTIPARDRTPSEKRDGSSWFHDFRTMQDKFVLQHSSLDAYLYLRFLKFIILVCFIGCCITWPILLPANATGGGTATQLDRITFSNIAKNNHLWAHVVAAALFFTAVVALIARERLRLIGTRQGYLLDEMTASRLSSKTVLFLNAPQEALQADNMQHIFGDKAIKIWPVKKLEELEDFVQERNDVAYRLEGAEVQLAQKANRYRMRRLKSNAETDRHLPSSADDTSLVPKDSRPTHRLRPLLGNQVDTISWSREKIVELTEQIQTARESSNDAPLPEQSAVFVAFSSQEAAHHAYEKIKFVSTLPTEHRYLGVQPKEVLWNTLTWTPAARASKASLALAFVIAFIIFFSIPVGIIGTLSNVKYLANNVRWLSFINDLPPLVLGLLEGLLPPFLVSWFVSYVPKLFRHVAKLSGEPTTPQAELKTQAWFFAFSVIQVFLVTTFSSGAAAVITKIVEDPASAPMLLAESLPKASNFYLTYFILQGTASAADAVLNYSDLLEYLFYDRFMTNTPREKYALYVQMKGISYGKLYPKFTNLLVIAVAYSCVAPLVLGFATVGISLYYLSYRYQFLYVSQSKIDTKGECYKRALQQMMTGVYLAEVCLIGLFAAREAAGPTACMIVLLVLTAIVNFLVDRMLRPLELYLSLDHWQEQEVPLLAEEDGIDPEDTEALHVASHNRRLGVDKLPRSAADSISSFSEAIVSDAREQMKSWLHDPSARADDEVPPLGQSDFDKAYLNPALTSNTPKLWLAKDSAGMSKHEIEKYLAPAKIPATDDGAILDARNRVQWDRDDFSKVPIFKIPTKY